MYIKQIKSIMMGMHMCVCVRCIYIHVLWCVYVCMHVVCVCVTPKGWQGRGKVEGRGSCATLLGRRGSDT